jgi:site-specific recombinase XerD
MKRKPAQFPNFLDLLEAFLGDYMPNSAGLSANTVKSYTVTFRLLFEYLYAEKHICSDDVSFATLNFDTVNGFLNHLEQERDCSIATRNQRLVALSSFAGYAQNRSLDAAVFSNVISKIPVKTSAVSPRTMFTLEEVAILLELPDKATELGLRDCVMLNLMYASGARAQEICDLTVRSVRFQPETTKLTLTGKRQKTRRINIAEPCAVLLKQYIAKRSITKQLDRHIFSSQTHEHMKTSCITEIFKKYVVLAKERHPLLFHEESYTPHSMRHTTATHMLEAGVPLMAIKNFLGHASVHTTERYAALTQATVNNYIREWNSKWFPHTTEIPEKPRGNTLPKFLR